MLKTDALNTQIIVRLRHRAVSGREGGQVGGPLTYSVTEDAGPSQNHRLYCVPCVVTFYDLRYFYSGKEFRAACSRSKTSREFIRAGTKIGSWLY